jgi:hypothetical protein
MRRLTPLLAASLLSLAFAPAPLPRRAARADDSVEVSRLLGAWRVTDPRGGATNVVITPTQWTFCGSRRVSYDLRIHHDRQPAEIEFMEVGRKRPIGRGIIRREGAAVRVVYDWGSRRPAGFDQAGFYALTLVRDPAP